MAGGAVFGGEVLQFGTGLDFSGLDSDLGSIGRRVKSATGPAVSAFKAVAAAGAAVGGAVLAIGTSAVSTGAEFESLEARLSTLLGSAEAGAARMREVMEAAASTPFELAELVDAEATLEGFGVNAPKWRDAVLDLSASLGIDLSDAANAVGRAFSGGAGAADVLRDRGVLAMLSLREGANATELDLDRFREALFDTLTDPDGRIAGGTKRLAATFSGLVSNLSDEWSRFNKEIADAGSFAAVKESLKITLELIERNRAGVNSVADTISGALVAGLKIGIDAIAFMNEAWTTTKALVMGLEGAYTAAWLKEIDLALGAVDLARALEQIPGIGDSIGNGLDEVEGFLLGKRGEVAAVLGEMDKEAASIAGEFGKAAAEAQAMKDRIDAAVDAARTRRDQDFSGFGGGGGDAPSLPGGGEDTSEKMADLIAKQAKLVGQITTAGDELARLAFEEEQALASLADITDQRLELAGNSAEEQLRIQLDFERDKLAIQQEFAERAVDIQRQAFVDSANHAASFASTVIGSLQTITEVSLEGASDKAKEAALAIFKVQKGLRIAEVIIDTARAGMAALLPPPVGFGPVAGAVAAGVIGAAGIATVATIAATKPQFHGGGSPAFRFAPSAAAAPDEVDARLTRREVVLDEGQQRGLMRILEKSGAAGGGGGGGGGNVVVRYRHREFNAVVRDNLRLPNSPLSQAVSAGRVSSQR